MRSFRAKTLKFSKFMCVHTDGGGGGGPGGTRGKGFTFREFVQSSFMMGELSQCGQGGRGSIFREFV